MSAEVVASNMGMYTSYVFPRILDYIMSGENFDEVRRKTLQNVRGNTLEIGFGTGLNLNHYPASLGRLVAIDVNPGMGAMARKRTAHSGTEVDHRVLDGQSLPIADGTFDSVVSTWTLCSIAEVDRALLEIYRVLAPGGRFFFVEHGLSKDSEIQKWQRRLTPIQKIVADGCHLDRNIESLIRRTGFHDIELETFYMERVPRVGGFLYQGVAVKSED